MTSLYECDLCGRVSELENGICKPCEALQKEREKDSIYHKVLRALRLKDDEQ